MTDLAKLTPFCPKCDNTDLLTYRGPPWTRCEGCGWEGNIWEGIQDALQALEADNARLRGLLWFAWNEFNSIRARDGSPKAACRNDPNLVSEEWWSKMTDSFAEAIGDDATTPWPSPEARAALRDTEEPGT